MANRVFLVLCVGIALATAEAGAETLVFQQGALLPGGGAYAGTRDTRIEASSSADAFGSSDTLRTDLDHNGAEAQALLRFGDLFGALPDRIPPGSTITSAVLTLGVFNRSTSPVGVISVYRLTTGWNDDSTWNSLVNGISVGSDTFPVADAAHTVEELGPASFDVLPSIQAWAQGAANRGWVFVNDSTDGVEFWSSEYTDDPTLRPKLTVTFTPPPGEPVVPALSRSGFAALLIALAVVGSQLARSGAARSHC